MNFKKIQNTIAHVFDKHFGKKRNRTVSFIIDLAIVHFRLPFTIGLRVLNISLPLPGLILQVHVNKGRGHGEFGLGRTIDRIQPSINIKFTRITPTYMYSHNT